MKNIVALCLLIFISGCISTPEISTSWTDKDFVGKKLQGTLVVAITENLALRKLFEDDYVKALDAKGVRAVASYTQDTGEPTKNQMIKMAKKNNLESVIVTNYIGSSTTDMYHADTYFMGGAIVIDSDGNSSTTYGYSYEIDGPNSYYTSNTYVSLACALYELSNQKMVWSAVSSAQSPGDPIELFSPFINSFIDELHKDQFIN